MTKLFTEWMKSKLQENQGNIYDHPPMFKASSGIDRKNQYLQQMRRENPEFEYMLQHIQDVCRKLESRTGGMDLNPEVMQAIFPLIQQIEKILSGQPGQPLTRGHKDIRARQAFDRKWQATQYHRDGWAPRPDEQA